MAAQTASQPRGATIRTKPDQPERREQEAVKKLLKAIGAAVWVAGTVRRHGDHPGTMQTPGLPDLPLVFLPAFKLTPPPAPGVPPLLYELVCIEVKSPAAAKLKWGGLTPEQRGVKAYCAGAGVPYIHGTLDDVIQWLVQRGYLKADQVPHYRLG